MTKLLKRLHTFMSIASQPSKLKSKLLKTRTVCPNHFKTISFQDHCIFEMNSRFLDAINHYNSNFTTKINSGGPQGPLTLCMSKFGSIIFKHKNSNNSETNGSNNLKFLHKVSCLHMYHPALYPQRFKRYHQKGLFLIPFKTLGQVPFKTIHIGKIQYCSYIYEISFQDHYLVPLYSSHCSKRKFQSFQDP